MIDRIRIAFLTIATLSITVPLMADWDTTDPVWPDPQEMGDRSYWVPLNDYGAQNPGAEPIVRVVPELSNLDQTTLDIQLHGFWVRAYRSRDPEMDRRFHSIDLNASRSAFTDAIGRPALPVINSMLGIAPDGTVDLFAPEVLGVTEFTNARIAPAQPDEIEYPDGANQPGPFMFDENFYGSQAPWPLERAVPRGGFDPQQPNNWRGLRVCSFNVSPFQVVPSANVLQVATKMRMTVAHPGSVDRIVELPRRSQIVFESFVLNFHVLVQYGLIGSMPDEFIGDYLFVGPEDDLLGALDLMRLKQERGYRIHTMRTEDMLDPLDPLAVYIDFYNWYQGLASNSEKFILIIGDETVVAPTWTSKSKTITVPVDDGSEDGETVEEEIWGISDQRYTCMDSDPYPELGIGRLPIRNDYDLEQYVERARAYAEDPPAESQYYSHATLVAHHGSEEENAYRECADDIMNASYDLPRAFSYIDGLQSWADNDLINNSLDSELGGITWYRGHGSTTSWAGWNLQNDPDDENDFSHHYYWPSLSSLLSSSSSMDGSPIVISVSCGNSAIDSDEVSWSFAEIWMHRSTDKGAIAHIGATRVSDRHKNNRYSKRMWKHLLDQDLYSISMANECSWVQVVDDYAPGTQDYDTAVWNQQVYMLLGDPETRVWHEEPIRLELELLGEIIPGGIFDSIVRSSGIGVQGVAVIVSNEAGPIVSGFTNALGEVSLNIPPGLAESAGGYVVRAWSDQVDSIDARKVVGAEIGPDFNGDGVVDGIDLSLLLGAWGTASPEYDLVADGVINGADLAVLLGEWTIGS
ncbi:MAG: C25 family cysteine peptidase [Phycisphaerales bacterium]|nr:C25 family cysteine peptidase [Phycisphaerales bacterium]